MALLTVTAICLSEVDGGPIGEEEGRPSVRCEEAASVVGKLAHVSGKVSEVRTTTRNQLLRFELPDGKQFTGVVRNEYLDRFPGSLHELYSGKYVRLRGFVGTYRGHPEIQLRDPSQVTVLEHLPEKPAPIVREKSSRGDRISVATFNMLNLFDDVDDPYTSDETTAAKPRTELERLAETIRQLDADVLALQEVENRGYLERFLDAFLLDMDYRFVVLLEGNDVRGIDVALASRIPLGRTHSHRYVTFPGSNGERLTFERDVLIVEILPPSGGSFEVWTVHLKSNYEGRDYAEPIRAAEAAEVRRMLDERLRSDPAAHILLCGDFNDVWESQTLKTLVGSGDTALRPLFEELPQEKRITYNRPPYLSMIDFLLASPALADRYVKSSYRIIPGSPETTGSDHNPVCASFALSETHSHSRKEDRAPTATSSPQNRSGDRTSNK